MKKKCYLSMSVLLLFILSGCSSKLSTLDGYILDKHCFEMKYSETSNSGMKGTDMKDTSKMACSVTNDPSKETKACLTMKDCEASGYGIVIKQDDGKYKFYKFDDKGHNLAKDILSKTKKADGFSITVKGTQSGETIKVSSILEK